MKKSQLYAMYDNFGDTITECSMDEFNDVLFNDVLFTNISLHHYKVNEETEVVTISTDGMDYMRYCASYKVGWQGDYDSDEFFCKKERITKAEAEQHLILQELWM